MLRRLTPLLLAACAGKPTPPPAAPVVPTATVSRLDEARAFVARADATLREAWVAANEAAWTYETDITDAHAEAQAAASERSMQVTTELVKASTPYVGTPGLSPEQARELEILHRGADQQPGPSDPARRKELATVLADLSGLYGKGEVCEDGTCRDLQQLEAVLAAQATAKDAAKAWDEQLGAWRGWHDTAKPMRPLYGRFVELGNEGARELGYADMGAMWRSGYDMPPDQFAGEVDRLWGQVEPLYEALHCHVRAKLTERYGQDKVPATGPIPAHVTGNMWAQEWGHLYPLVAPYPKEPSLDVTAAMKAKGWDVDRMFHTAEGFFTSLGLDPLPATFWTRSMLVQPPGREAVCHASAWDVTYADDLRIKMCTEVKGDDLVTIHHEMGHLYYDHAYHELPILLQNGANDGFHEAIGDAIALSMTPEYLNRIGLLDQVGTSEASMLDAQMQRALDKVAFLPFGRLIDLWRWGVFSGDIPPERWNEAWWELREKVQGVAPSVPRTEADFDPGAKYHIPANTPYMRYFLAAILQFQFHEGLCRAAGHTGPLHTCSIFGSKEAGDKLEAMLELGASKPWPDALEVVTGSRQLDAGPMLAYFAPLKAWLDTQNQGRTCGW
jgi:peptidyl-dipeptidase A